MLRERTQGVPYWCEQLLIDMTEKKQLIVTYDDGSSTMRENTIAPNAAQLKRVFSDHSLEDVLDENDNDQIEYNRVNSSFRVEDEEVIYACARSVAQLGSTIFVSRGFWRRSTPEAKHFFERKKKLVSSHIPRSHITSQCYT